MINVVKRNKRILEKYSYDPEIPIKAVYYDYQKSGINFGARSLKKHGSLILADEQGLGKTLEAMSITYKLKNIKRVLVICPASARGEWKRMLNQFTNASYSIVYSNDAFESRTRFFVVNYDRLKNIHKYGLNGKFDCVICDEFHNIKNKDTLRAKMFNKLRFKYGIYLSGTPILNKLEELWVALHKIDPDNFNNYSDFVQDYSKVKTIRVVRYIGRRKTYYYFRKYYGGKNIDKLQKIISPYFLRRRKKEVLKSLPDKIYQNLYVELKSKQKKAYDKLVKDLKVKIANKTIKIRSAFAEFTRARQICGTLATLGMKDESASLDELEVLAKDYLYGDHKFFIVAPFKLTARAAYDRLRKMKYRCVYVDGDTNPKDSNKFRTQFQSDNRIKAYIGTIPKNKEALTLTAADYIIFIGRSVVQKINEQIEDRLHRIGQKRVVNVINIINKNTVEEKIEEKILLPKAQLFSEMFDGVSSSKMTLDQIRKLI